ncbi:hypothetical protein GCM10022397_38690 [Flavivirga jejuensis]
MITSSLLFTFLGSFFLYNTSKKVVLSQNLIIEKWIQTNTLVTKAIGVIFYITALVMAIISFGKMSGTLFWLNSLMLLLGLMVIFSPLKRGLYKLVSIILLTLFTIELFF